MPTRIAYFINQYPIIATSFVRREILALERQGFEVQRIALRGWDSKIVDPDDELERPRTRYVLQEGVLPLVWALLRTLFLDPKSFAAGLVLAIRMGWRAERPMPYHLACLAEACRILPWLKQFGATHIHAHFGTNSAEIVMLVRTLGGPPYSFTLHGPTEFDKPRYLGVGEKIRRSAFVVAITSFTRSQMFRWVEHAYWDKIKVVHCGLEPKFFTYNPIPLDAAPRLVCLGRLVEQKGQLLLIEAARHLAEKGVAFELALIGDGDLRPELERLIDRYGLTGRVLLLGSISTDQLRDEILRARGLVMPSFAEGLPMAIMEAMALGRPVLTTYIAGIPELIRHGQDGWLFPAGSIEALTTAMEDCLSRPIEELRAMGESGYHRVLERHSADVETAKLAALFRQSST
jgi:colanic acid/amylovoran biosynthesis glycosyltransferase